MLDVSLSDFETSSAYKMAKVKNAIAKTTVTMTRTVSNILHSRVVGMKFLRVTNVTWLVLAFWDKLFFETPSREAICKNDIKMEV